jgi:ABC-type polysaccharide/polyol phosphate transport system ATPase subunit
MKKYAIKIEDMTFDYEGMISKNLIRKSIFSWNQINKKFTKVFNNINFEIKKGSIIGLYSQNGTGKTTLLKLINGVYHPTKGKIYVNGSCNSMIDIFAGAENEASGIENIYIRSLLNGKNEKEIKDNLDNIIKFSELGNSIEKPFKTYSSGMKLRLAFSTSVLTDADIYLIDEWISVGDTKFQKKCLKKLNSLKRYKKTILIASQNLEFLKKFCNKVYTIQDLSLSIYSD